MTEHASWLWGEISREQAEELILGGDRKDGTFLVRARPKHVGQYLLTLVFRGRATHHLLVKSPDSQCWTINKKQFGSCQMLTEVVSLLREPVAGWPVVLSTEISNPDPSESSEVTTTDIEESSTGDSSADGVPQTVDTTTPDIANTSNLDEIVSVDSTNEDQPYFHGQISRDESEAIIRQYASVNKGGSIDGLWLVRQRAGKVVDMSELVILVGYQGRCTHHLCQKQPDGMIKVNGKDTNQSSSLSAVLTFLKNKPPFWPVDMDEFVPVGWKEPSAVPPPTAEQSETTVPQDVVTTAAAVESSSASKALPVRETEQHDQQQARKPFCRVTTGPSSYDLPNTPNVAQLFEATPKLSIVIRRLDYIVDMGFVANIEIDGKPPTISNIQTEGTAYTAGLRIGDVIVKVNSQSTIAGNPAQIQALFQEDTLEVALLIARPPFKGSRQAYDEEEDNFPEDGYYTDE